MSERSLTCTGTAEPFTSWNSTSVKAPPVCAALALIVSSESNIHRDSPSPRSSRYEFIRRHAERVALRRRGGPQVERSTDVIVNAAQLIASTAHR
ncbi:hypothetical protein BJF90_10415 [Pseudonocardia sp. CNS-004]|nr:hypothetical protein BJF90_10415 [Pseudonocardia sp. CNS-004]